MQKNSISKLNARPSPTTCTCLVLERGHSAIEFLEDAQLEAVVDWRFAERTECDIVIVIKTPDGILNSLGCERHHVVGALKCALQWLDGHDSKWGVLCSPAVRLPTMALLAGAYKNDMVAA